MEHSARGSGGVKVLLLEHNVEWGQAPVPNATKIWFTSVYIFIVGFYIVVIMIAKLQ